jgi:hypothetical protein
VNTGVPIDGDCRIEGSPLKQAGQQDKLVKIQRAHRNMAYSRMMLLGRRTTDAVQL